MKWSDYWYKKIQQLIGGIFLVQLRTFCEKETYVLIVWVCVAVLFGCSGDQAVRSALPLSTWVLDALERGHSSFQVQHLGHY